VRPNVCSTQSQKEGLDLPESVLCSHHVPLHPQRREAVVTLPTRVKLRPSKSVGEGVVFTPTSASQFPRLKSPTGPLCGLRSDT